MLAVRRPEAKLFLLRLAAHAQSVLVLPLDMLVLFTALLLNELLNQGNLVVGTGVHGVTRHHVVRQGHDHLAVRHLFVVEGVNLGEKRLDLGLFLQHVHDSQELLELDLANDTVLVAVHRLEEVGELDQEALVLLQLEVEDDLAEV